MTLLPSSQSKQVNIKKKKKKRQELHSFGFYTAVKKNTSINLVLKPKTWEALVDISLSLNSRPT